MPGFVDTHIHAPQYRSAGTGYDLQLSDWLKTYTFPTEAAFSDVAIACEVYLRVVVRYIMYYMHALAHKHATYRIVHSAMVRQQQVILQLFIWKLQSSYVKS